MRPNPSGNHPMVLVVDDEASMRDLVAAFLREQDIEVLAAPSAEEASRLIRETPKLDLILLDILMPGMGGRELMAHIRRSAHKNCPIVLISALSADDGIVESYLDGADYYLTKPFELDELANVVDYFLQAQLRE